MLMYLLSNPFNKIKYEPLVSWSGLQLLSARLADLEAKLVSLVNLAVSSEAVTHLLTVANQQANGYLIPMAASTHSYHS